MKEFIEKLIGRLEELPTKAITRYKGGAFGDYEGTDHFIDKYKTKDIINELAEEYINTSTNTSTTNADRIRSMTDEELAELFTTWSCEDNDYTTLLEIKDCKWGTKQEVMERNLKWLQSEVKGE